MNDILSAEDWNILFDNKTLDEKVQILQEVIDKASNKCIPLMTQKKDKSTPPWMSKKSRKQLRKKQCAWKRYCESKSYQKYIQYTKERNKCAKAIKRAKKDYEKKLSEECKKNPKVLFQYANFKNKAKSNIIRLKDENGDFVTKDIDNANILNNYFASVYTDEDDAPELILNAASNWLWGEDDTEDPFEHNQPTEIAHNLSDIIIKEDDIIDLLKGLDPFKSSSPDCIYPRILKECSTSLAPAIANIYRHSMTSGTLPANWKNGTVKPLYKGENRHAACNYRPVTLTSLLCRTLEKIIKKEVLAHLTENNLLINEQHGFLPKRSCMTNLLITLEEITELFDTGQPIDEIFLDFQKAFDKVPHQRLLYKIEKMGISGQVLNWIEDFLLHRKQRVSINANYSKWTKVKSGVPQGSVLGPILFLIFINDIGMDLLSPYSIFADDSKLYRPINSLEDTEDLQQDLNTLTEWCRKWKMMFNKKKCRVLQIGKRNMHYLYHLDGCILDSVQEETDLGIVISKDLKMQKNVKKNIAKANKMLGMIKRTFSYLDENIFLKLYKAYVRPQLEYCQQICSPYLLGDINEIEKVQRRATKLLSHLKDLPYEDRLEKLKLYSLEGRRKRGDMILTFQLLKGFVNVDTSKMFKVKQNSRTRGHCMKLESRRIQTEIRRNFFTNRIISPWNALSNEIIESKTLEEFKRRYDKDHGYHI